MTDEMLRLGLLSFLGGAAGLWLLTTLLFRVGGTWERVPDEDEVRSDARLERLTLGQLGPLVNGRRDVAGGHQEFSGVLLGRTLRLQRRDFGVQSLIAQGFPEPIARQLDGEVTARMTLRLVDSGTGLVGDFVPQKVEFTHRPPKITAAYFLTPQPRRYRRVIPLTDTEPVEPWAEELAPAPSRMSAS
ncbi:MAG: hypothetical protein ACO3JL_01105 [Myxococcota bacterium]